MSQIKQIHCIPVLSDNYVWVIEGVDNTCAVVDPGQAEPVLAFLEAHTLTPVAVLITHHHHDHIGGLSQLTQQFSLDVYGPEGLRGQGVNHPVKEQDQINLANITTLDVLETPGHTQGHLCFYNDAVIFCGDTLFTLGCGRLFDGNAAQMQQSMDKLRQLPDDLTMYCGHEYTQDSLKFALHCDPDNPVLARRAEEINQLRAQNHPTASANLGLEKQTNPFLRVRDPVIRQAIEAYEGRKINDDAAAFAVLRHWKDDFDGLARLPD